MTSKPCSFLPAAPSGGKKLDDNNVLVIHIRDGKWAEAWGYSADLYAWDEFRS
jgi:hypothetical protein